MERFNLKKNFNIASTVINENIRVSTAAIFYDCPFFGDYYQLETIVFSKFKGEGKMKIHNVYENNEGIDYCVRFHNKTVNMIRKKIAKEIYENTKKTPAPNN